MPRRPPHPPQRQPPRQDRPITLDLVRDALSFIPPDVPHDDRVRLAFAVWDGVGDAGADAWLSWAAQRSSADATEDRDTWKSARKPGRVKVGTLFGIAKDNGFRFPEVDSDAPAPDPAALAAAKAERERRHLVEEAQYRERADKAARWARDLWGDASEAGSSPYLNRKGAQAHGVRFLPDGTLLVPMRNAAGELQNLQRIAPVKPAADQPGQQPEKRFLPSGRKSGLWHLIGELGSAPADVPADLQADAPPVLLLAEGYATAASLHEATGWPVAVCFDAGNLKPCALALHELHPAALLLVCGDDDRATEERTGSNPGRGKGAAAARAVLAAGGRAGLVLPAGLPDGGTDFNDLHAHAGADAVRTQVQAAALALLAGAASADPVASADACDDADPVAGPDACDNTRDNTCDNTRDDASDDASDTGPADSNAPADASAGPLGADPPLVDPDAPAPGAKRSKGRKSSRARSSSNADAGDTSERDGGADLPGGFDRFRVDDSGVWFTPPAGDDGTTGSARRVCDRLEVLALARDMHDKGGALLLDFDSQFGRGRRWLMPLSMLAGDGAAYRAELLDMGFIAPTDGNRRRWLTEYLQSRRPTDRVRLVDRVGWQGRAYVLPRETLTADAGEGSDPAERLMFHSEAPMEDAYTQRGSLAQWQERIGRHCIDNSRLLFSVSVALAGPVLGWVPGMESGGFHLRGDSSCGKTTALRVAASVWGGKDYLQRWRATDNGLEAQAAQHSDGVLVLDELGQLDAKVAGESAYMLANGQGKARAGRNGGARPRLSWRLLWLSAGEIPLAQHMAEAGKRIRAGQELRMVDMPADAGVGLGLFDTVHDHEGGAALAQHLARVCESTHGAIGRAWLEWLVEHSDSWPKDLRADVDALTLQFVPDTADGQIKRAGRRFALVAAAGELATRQGLTGWPEGAATEGVKRCFHAWVNARPAGFGSSEKAEALRQVRAYLEKNGDALFTWWHRAMDDHKPNTALRAGFKRMIDEAGQPVKYDSADDYCDSRAGAGGRIAEGFLVEYLILPEAFRNEVCKGLDAQFVARVLADTGCLKHERDRLTIKHRLPGMGKSPVFHVLPSVFDAEAPGD